jgi:hypothetical protein
MATAGSDDTPQSASTPGAAAIARMATSRDIAWLGGGLIVLGLLLAYLLASVWPPNADALKGDAKAAAIQLLWISHVPLKTCPACAC